jgi:hypothetical protein
MSDDPVFWAFGLLFLSALVVVGLLAWYGRDR